jgi:hypothetical protein
MVDLPVEHLGREEHLVQPVQSDQPVQKVQLESLMSKERLARLVLRVHLVLLEYKLQVNLDPPDLKVQPDYLVFLEMVILGQLV